jgi:RNA-binding protein
LRDAGSGVEACYERAMSASPKPPTSRQLAHLRALAHHLAPIVQLGKDGLGEPVVAATRTALLAHELVKVKLPQIEKAERRAITSELTKATGAHLVAEIGRVAVLYKRHPSEPKIALPK